MANYLNNFRYGKPAALSKLAAAELAWYPYYADHENRQQKIVEAYDNLLRQSDKEKADLQTQVSDLQGTNSYLKGDMNQRAAAAREKVKKTKEELARAYNELDAANARESVVRKERNAWRSGAYTLGGAGAGYGLTSLLTRNPWLRGAGAGIGGIGGYLAANPKIVTDFINRFKNNNKMASVSGKAMNKLATSYFLKDLLPDNVYFKIRDAAGEEYRKKNHDRIRNVAIGANAIPAAGIGGGLAYLIARKITENRLARAGITGAGALIGGTAGAYIGNKLAPSVENRLVENFKEDWAKGSI